MSIWQGAVALLRHEMRRSWLGVVATILFFIYMVAVMSPLFQGSQDVLGWPVDFLYLTILPNMGFLMSRNLMAYWRNDAFTRKIAYWRTMPISMDSIVLARMLQLLCILFPVGLFFFTLQYLLFSELRSMMGAGHYLLFAATWIGYALAASATYVYFEQTCSGRVFFIVCFAYLAVYASVVVILALTGTHLIAESIEAARSGNWVPAAAMPVIGFAATAVTGILIRRRLAARSLLS